MSSRPVAIDHHVLIDACRIAEGEPPLLFTIDEVLQALTVALLFHDLEHVLAGLEGEGES